MSEAVKRPRPGAKEPGLETFFSPRSVAVIGASPSAGNLGARILASLSAQGYDGALTAVNPHASPLPPVPAVASVEALPEGVDLAIAAIPASGVPALVRPLAARGVRHLIVVGGGFAETGSEGARLERALGDEARRAGVRVIGPNGLGVFSAPGRFNSFFLSPGDLHLPGPGPLAVVSQSGAFLSLLLDGFEKRGLGVACAVNFGNRVDVGEVELLEAFARDPAIRVIGLYLESFEDGARFVAVARRISRDKPIVLWKGGESGQGSRAARSHSASLAGSYAVFQAAVESAGLIEARGFEEFRDALEALARQPVPAGSSVLAVSNGGGMGVFLADLCERRGLRLPAPSEALMEKVAAGLPEYFSIQNPVDLTGSGTNSQCASSAQALMRSGEFDSLLLVLLSGTEGIDQGIAPLFPGDLSRPLAAAVYGDRLHDPLARAWRARGLPVFETAEAAAWALAVLMRRRQVLDRPEEEPAPAAWAEAWRSRFARMQPDELAIKAFLSEQGVPVPACRALSRAEQVDLAARALRFPLVLKAAQPGLLHKSEQGAVATGIRDAALLRQRWREMEEAFPGTLFAEEEAPPGLDLLVGFHREAEFGPLLVFGAGGKYVEVFAAVERLLLPAASWEFARLLNRSLAGRLIAGVRGEKELAREPLLEFIEQAAGIFVACPEYLSLEFNPVRLFEDRLVVLDAKLAMAPRDEKGDPP